MAAGPGTLIDDSSVPASHTLDRQTDPAMFVFMSTAAQVIDRLVPPLGLLPSTMDRYLRADRSASFVPSGGRGGGKNSAHFEDYDLAKVLMSLAGLQPSDGPEAIRQLRGLPYRGSRNHPDVAPPLPTLEDQITYWINKVALPYTRGEHWLPESLEVLRSWQMQLCLNPRAAIIQVGVGPAPAVHIYAADATEGPAMRRLTLLTGDVLLACGELYADTVIQRNAVECVQFLDATKPAKAGRDQDTATPSFSDPSRANAAPESNNAGHPRQGVPASKSDQPTPMGPAASPLRKVSAKTKFFKDAPSAGLVTADE